MNKTDDRVPIKQTFYTDFRPKIKIKQRRTEKQQTLSFREISKKSKQ